MNKNISFTRKKILKKYITISKTEKKNENYLKSVLSYPCTWYRNLGFEFIKINYKKNFFRFTSQFFKEIVLIGYLHNYRLTKYNDIQNYNNLIISWCNSEDLKKKIFEDKYIPIKKNSLFFLLNVGQEFIYKKNLNNKLLYQKKNKSFSLKYLLFTIFKTIYKSNFSFKNIIYNLNWHSIFSDMVAQQILQILENSKIKIIYIPFEAQPFQKLIIKTVRERFKNIKIIGYINAIQPWPIHLFDKKVIPDKCYSMSPTQIFQLTKIFKWDKKKIQLVKSNRFHLKNKLKYRNRIVLPFNINDSKITLHKINKLFETMPKNYFNKFEVAPHPVGLLDKNYKYFVRDINQIIKRFNYKFSRGRNKNFAIVIGSTSSIFECLEYKLNVFHIAPQPILEALDNYYWPKIKISSIDKNIYFYSTKYSKKFINY